MIGVFALPNPNGVVMEEWKPTNPTLLSFAPMEPSDRNSRLLASVITPTKYIQSLKLNILKRAGGREEKCSEPQIMVTPQISRYYALHCKGQWRVSDQEALTTRQCPSSLLRTTNGSAEPSAWKKMDVSSDIKAGSLPRTYSVEPGRKKHKEFV